jgi:6-phosphogluconolactonase
LNAGAGIFASKPLGKLPMVESVMLNKARRTFVVSCVALALGLPGGAVLARGAASELVYIGQHGPAISAARFNTATGDLSLIGPVAPNRRPTWAVMHPTLPIVYFNEESGNEGDNSGGIHALKMDAKTGALTKIADVRAGGGGTTNLWFDAASHTILAANYGGGSLATIPVNPDGTLGAVTSLVSFPGKGPHKRQGSSHAHGVSLSPDGRWALVTDLGADRVWVVAYDRKTGKLGAFDPASPQHFVFAPGTGPRHMTWAPSGKFLYVVDELTANVESFGWDGAKGQLSHLGSQSSNVPGFTGEPSVSEITISADGRFLYVGNRGDNTIDVYRVNPATGALKEAQRVSTGGKMPWHFALHGSGRWVLVANRDSNAVNVLARDPRSGLLRDTGKALTMNQPVHVVFTGR